MQVLQVMQNFLTCPHLFVGAVGAEMDLLMDIASDTLRRLFPPMRSPRPLAVILSGALEGRFLPMRWLRPLAVILSGAKDLRSAPREILRSAQSLPLSEAKG